MPKKKKKSNVKQLMKLGLFTGVGAASVGALPSTSPESASIKQNLTGGFSRFSTGFKPAFKLAGTTIILKQTKRLVKTTKKLKRRRKKR